VEVFVVPFPVSSKNTEKAFRVGAKKKKFPRRSRRVKQLVIYYNIEIH
jgi:hypothetical protein